MKAKKFPLFNLFVGSDRQHYFSLYAVNGEIIFSSEGYTSEAGAQKGIAAVKRQSCFEKNFTRKVNANYDYWFTLDANNNEILGRSEMYSTAYNRDNGIKAVMRDAPVAEILKTDQSIRK